MLLQKKRRTHVEQKNTLESRLITNVGEHCLQLFTSRYWYIKLIGTKSISISLSSPGASSSHAGGAEAEVPSCCAGEVCFSRERWQGGKSATAHSPAPCWIWDNLGQLARVGSESPQLCAGNRRDARDTVPAQGEMQKKD